MPGSEVSTAPEKDRVAVSLLRLELRREGDMRVGESKAGLGPQDRSQDPVLPCGEFHFPGGLEKAFQTRVHLDAQEPGTGLAAGREAPFAGEGMSLGCDCSPCPAQGGMCDEITP